MARHFLRDIWADKWVKLVALLAVTAAALALVIRIRQALSALAIAWFLAYLCDPLADRLEKRRVPRTAAVAVITLLLAGILILFVMLLLPVMVGEIVSLSENLPDYGAWFFERAIPSIEAKFGVYLPHTGEEVMELINENQTQIKEFGYAIYSPVLIFLRDTLGGLVNFIVGLLTLAVVPVAWFFLLRDIDKINVRVVELTPPRHRERFVSFMKQVDAIVSGFIHGQVFVALLLGVMYSIGLWLILDIPLGLVIGIVAGFAAIIPYLGLLLGIVPALLMAFLKYQDWQHPLGVAAVFAVAQAVEGNLITPKVMSNRLGMHPVLVIFSILVGAKLLGVLGMLLAIPVAAVLQVVMRDLVAQYRAGRFFNQAADE